MRVAVQCESIVPGASAGIEHFVYGLLGGLAVADECELHVAIARGTRVLWEERVTAPAIRFHEVVATASIGARGRAGNSRSVALAVKRRFAGSPSAAWAVRQARLRVQRRFLARVRPDAVYQPYHRAEGEGKPAVVTVHDLRVMQPESELYDAAEAAKVARNIRRAGVITTSWKHPWKQILATFPEHGERVVHIPIPPLVSVRRVAGVAVEPDLLLYPASTGAHKNHLRLIEAIHRVRRDRPVRLLCVGPQSEPGYSAALRRRDELGLRDHVSFAGFVTDDELRRLYASAAAVVIPSLWEAASGPITEAFVMGRPVACSDIAPLRSQVAELHGDASFFDPADADAIAAAIGKVLSAPERYLAASERAAAHISSLTWERTAADYLDAFARAAGSPSRADTTVASGSPALPPPQVRI